MPPSSSRWQGSRQRLTLTIDELESGFDDPVQMIETSYPGKRTGEARYRIIKFWRTNKTIV